ncbi:alpha/beta fold hydrolase [Leptospira wolffii]|uniref:Alpha/beta hydrolase n=1 Tax=Leptospira wolffii TaxID=409998 RepID=A0A2M9Z8I0_9LEPT|nr:alpha/beta hydrolase [Leptospira wolffii]EPG67073.1 alpha/beta hydrolase family protein [Leptospira wolffii serovar Khorat str. Khorat-H2]PJZ64720.1 alpha/beta hydrolase [Leptospira wolffii]
MKKFAASFLFLLIVSSSFVSCTGALVRSRIGYERWSGDLERKELRLGPWNWVYLEGGEGKEKILLVHGFGGDKDNWTRFAKRLTEDYTVIAMDLPGFGENERLQDEHYGIYEQVSRLDAFVKAVGWEKFHIVGNSMGGCISGVYASKYPEKVITLGLFAPSGVNSPEKSELAKNLENGKNNLVVNNPEEFQDLMKFIFVNPPSIPSFVASYFGERAVKNAEFNKLVFKDIRKEGFPLQENMGKIKAKTLVLWGDTDRVLSVSGAGVLEKGIRGSKKVILKDIGHVPMLEKPEEVAKIYKEFLIK